MGSVAIDVHKKERQYENLTLSDESVVKYLILYRSKVDVSYGANINININQAGDTFEFNQELIALYASIDEIIDKMNMRDRDKDFLLLIFEGYTISDIVEEFGYARRTAYNTLNKIVERIVDSNGDNWKNTMRLKGYVFKKETENNE